jgi:phospho-N-acetylmuramoyl-pentapeptide-transferase
MIVDAARVFIPAVVSFVIGIAFAPVLSHFLYRYKAWKKVAGKGKGIGGGGTPIFDELHKEREVSTPRLGGVLIWVSVVITAGALSLLGHFFGQPFAPLAFINRNQTWLPFFALLTGAFVGLVDDLLEITKSNGGLPLRTRLLVVGAIAAFSGWWFYAKLAVDSVGIPFAAPLHLGIFFIPFFIFVALFIYASGIIDGIDGLAGGVFGIVFMAYAGIAFMQDQLSIAGFCGAVAGAVLAFLWFNVPPARFYLSETGSMALTLALTITAFSTDTLGEGVGVFVLPILAFPLTITVVSSVLQVFWKVVFKRKLFRVAPVHHHFEALGWPAYKVTMRYWIITIIAGAFGLSLALLK